MKNKKYYVYLHIKKTNGEPFYVGKGTGKRYKSKDKRSLWWLKIVKKYDYDIIFLEENLSEIEALELEIYWINRIGRKILNTGPLINLTNGGEGVSGFKHSIETKNKISESLKGTIPWNKDIKGFFKHSDKFKENMSKRLKEKHPLKNKPMSEETKNKISESLKGKIAWNKDINLSYEHKEKIKKSHIGKTLSKEIKEKISKSVSKNSTNRKLILDMSTGIFYESLSEASYIFNINKMTLSDKLLGKYKNNTSLIYV